jgi:hypothetical protein
MILRILPAGIDHTRGIGCSVKRAVAHGVINAIMAIIIDPIP